MGSSIKRWRSWIYERDNYTCYYCGDVFDAANLHIDHKTPKVEGGKDRKDNLVTACRECNLLKGAYNIDEFIKKVFEKHHYHHERARYFAKIIKRYEKHLIGEGNR